MKAPREIIDHLSPTDALSILRILVDSDELLAGRIATDQEAEDEARELLEGNLSRFDNDLWQEGLNDHEL